MKVLTAAQMRHIDDLTIRSLGLPGTVLMENAGTAVVSAMLQKLVSVEAKRITVLCGKGNNGGDGCAVARLLAVRGGRPEVVLLCDPETITGDARIHYDRMLQAGCKPRIATDSLAWCEVREHVLAADIVIDAILGTGLSGPARGLAAEVIGDLNRARPRPKVVAVDIPSGLPSDSEQPLGESVQADLTVTFTAPKIGQVLPPNCERVGDLVISPIGTPVELVENTDSLLNLITVEEIARFVQPRPKSAHKGDFGHVLVVAGSRGKTGAAVMAGEAALKIGAGLVTVATAETSQPVVASFVPELMTEALPETDTGAISARSLEYGRFQKIAGGKTVILIGPGMGTHPDTVAFTRRVLEEITLPIILDADALNAFAGEVARLNGRVLTPHPGEMSRLVGVPAKDIQQNRVEVARRTATAHGLHLILKGYRTLIAAPDGQAYVNPTGNPGMAKGGTGDVLAGFVAGLMAQFPNEPLALVLCAAVYIHGLAGDLAVSETGEKSLMARDLIRWLPHVWRRYA